MAGAEVRFLSFRENPTVEIAGPMLFPQGVAAVAAQNQDFRREICCATLQRTYGTFMFINDEPRLRSKCSRRSTETLNVSGRSGKENVSSTHHATWTTPSINRVLRWHGGHSEDYLNHESGETAARYHVR